MDFVNFKSQQGWCHPYRERILAILIQTSWILQKLRETTGGPALILPINDKERIIEIIFSQLIVEKQRN